MRWTLLLLTLAACTRPEPVVSVVPYANDFEAPLGPEWSSKATTWEVIGGRLHDSGARNQPLWLAATLPNDVRVSFTADPQTPDVDFKFELFGNGRDHESGYSVLFGAWHNTKSEIARLGEHAPQRTATEEAQLRAAVADNALRAETISAKRTDCIRKDTVLSGNRSYAVVFERVGNNISVILDDEPFMTYFDPSPLNGPNNDRFAFSNWATSVFFDNLKIDPL